MRSFLSKEPVLTVAVLQAVLALLAAFGAELSPEAQAAAAGLLAAVLALLRANVMPLRSVAERVDDAAAIAATSVARQISGEVAGPAGTVTEASRELVESAVALAGAAVSPVRP